MLGKLFNLGTGNAASNSGPQHTSYPRPPQPSLESVQEDIHTRHLLFPEAEALFQHQNDQVFPLSTALPSATPGSPFDYDADIELETRHVRVLIMQDAAGPYPSQLLFDSQGPPPPAPTSTDRSSAGMPTFQDPRRTPTSPRKSSLNQGSRPLVIQPDSPQPRQGAFDRRASLQGRTQTSAETEMQRARREYNDEINAFSSCTFGNSELMAYKGTSTKVHIVPSSGDGRTEYAGSLLGDGRGSIGRSNRRKILITRLFPVIMPTDDTENDTPISRYSDQNGGFPFPPPDETVPKKKPQPKQKRTPMYAVVLVIQLPPSPNQPMPPPPVRSTFRGPGSFTDHDSFASSMSSARRSGWAMPGSGHHNESLESSFSADVDDRMDVVTQHWDIIMRTLTHLQSAVAVSLGALLKQEDITSPDPSVAPIASFVGRTPSLNRRGDDAHMYKPPKTNSKLISLQSHRLQHDEMIAQHAAMARVRVVSGLRAQRVITGQGRWGIWRDEARWMARRAGEREDGFSFFFNLLTGFLATHMDWLQALSPTSYRRKYYDQQRAKGEEDLFLPARTIIVSQDKMLARRLIFLLSAFLPANQQVPTARPHRPSTSTSIGAFSQSPPSYVVPILREESLRRKINRRTGPRRTSHTRNMSQSTRMSGVPAQLAHLAMEGHHERRFSDVGSLRSNLPIPGNDVGSRKSSAATTTTITPETSIPHFSTIHRVESRRRPRPGSSSSIAADDLKRSLIRGETSGHMSTASTDSRISSSRWGSMISGLWSTAARRGSSNLTMHESSSPTSPSKPNFGRPDKLVEMVREASIMEDYHRMGDPRPSIEGSEPQTPRGYDDEQAIDDEPERLVYTDRTPDPTSAFQSPVKTTINPEDGVIDVDIPFPDYITSFETAVSSPSSSGYLSTPGLGGGLDGFEQLSRIVIDGDLPMNVAGYLQRYHQDFVLQAIPPQDDLVEQVKQSMRSEPTPFIFHKHSTDDSADRWVDVSSVLIADTATHLIKRIRYRRLIRPRPWSERPAPMGSAGSSVYGTALLTPSVMPYEHQLEEEFIEEHFASLDDVLTEAVERVIAQGLDTSKQNSSNSSRSTSKGRERSNSEASQLEEGHAIPHMIQEVPRGECKSVVLSALHDIIRDVVEKREHENECHNGNGSNAASEERESVLREAVRGWLDCMDASE
ncbi:hypothetical protein ACHAQA_005647 [Verticillium albo-atrum]